MLTLLPSLPDRARHLIAFRSKKIDVTKDFVHCGFKYTWQGIPVTDPTSSVRPAPAPPADFPGDVRCASLAHVRTVQATLTHVPTPLCALLLPPG